MTALRAIYHLARADFFERTRRASFVLTIFFAMALTYFFVPALDAPLYLLINLGDYRPLYTSAWIGGVVTLLMAEFFLLFGFYIVKGVIERDRQTGVGQIIAATSLSKPVYLLGKWLSHWLLFAALVVSMIVASLVLQLIRGESFTINLWHLAAPQLLVLLPALAMVAACAVFFDSTRWLRGGLGNLLYFVVFGTLAALTDFQGIQLIWPSIYQACSAHFPDCNPVRQIDLNAISLVTLPTFEYPGPVWDVPAVIGRWVIWISLALIVVGVAAIPFHRFDPAKSGELSTHKGWLATIWERLRALLPGGTTAPLAEATSSNSVTRLTLLTEAERSGGNAFQVYGRLFKAELRLAFSETGWFWRGGAVLLIALGLFLPADISHGIVLPLAWFWPIFRWSALGMREAQHNTELYVFAGPYAWQQWLVSWLMGVLIALVLGSGALLKLTLTGQWAAAGMVLLGAGLIPAVALAMGSWSGGNKLFEAVYLFVWYMASVQSLPFLDFMGRFPSTYESPLPLFYALILGLALGAAFVGRLRQMRR